MFVPFQILLKPGSQEFEIIDSFYDSTSYICSGRGGGASVKLIHISFVFLAFSSILFSTAQTLHWVQSTLQIARFSCSYGRIHGATVRIFGFVDTCLFRNICMLNKVGEIADPWGTPAGHDAVKDSAPWRFTCCVLPSRKLIIHNQKLLVTFISASLSRRILWLTKSNSFRKSTNRAWTPCLPVEELSVESNQFWDMEVRADTVEWPLVNACWFVFILKLDLLSWSCSFSITFASCGSTETWRKSLSRSVGGQIFGMGLMIACL
jgi:hypothetical protein